jgi:hypothetical protein
MNNNQEVFSAMQTGKPYKTYRKTILGKVSVTLLDPFTDQPIGILLKGNPKTDETAKIDIWTEREDMFFKRMNKRHFEIGNILEIVRKEEVIERGIESYSDEELAAILKTPFLSLQSTINKVESEAVMLRIVELAKEMEKSAKIMKVLESRLSELQSVTPFPDSITTVL